MNKGFFLYELLVITAIIALLSAVMLSMMTLDARLFVRKELDHLYSLCCSLQRRAIALRCTCSLFFDTQEHTYQWDTGFARLTPGVRFAVPACAYGPPSYPTHALTDPVTCVDHVLYFYPDGSSSAGVVYLADDTLSVAYALSYAIGSSPLMRRYAYGGETWRLLA